MNETLMPMLKLSMLVFMAGNLLDMGLKLDAASVFKGLLNPRFVALTVLWGFVVGPALAYAIARLLALNPHHANGLMLMGMAPSAPFLPMIVARAKGDLGSTAVFMLLATRRLDGVRIVPDERR